MSPAENAPRLIPQRALYAVGIYLAIKVIMEATGHALEHTAIGDALKEHPCVICGGSGWIRIKIYNPVDPMKFIVEQIPCFMPYPHLGD